VYFYWDVMVGFGECVELVDLWVFGWFYWSCDVRIFFLGVGILSSGVGFDGCL